MGRRSLPPGFRFHPTHVELIMFYLKKKVMCKKLPSGVISDLDIYKYAPWDLPAKSCLKSGDLKWYFFCPREKKYASGARMNRATEFGYWKSTGRDRPVDHNDKVVGKIKTLTFFKGKPPKGELFKGKPPKGELTDWVMHEYRIEENNQNDFAQDAYVLCVIFRKDGPGPRNGAQYGAPFNEEEWDSDSVEEVHSLETNPAAGLSVPSVLSHSKEPESSNPYDASAPKSNIFGRSSDSCISEILPPTLMEIPQLSGGDIASLEIPQTRDNDDGFLIQDFLGSLHSTFGEENQGTSNVIHGTVAASNYPDGCDIFKDLGDLGHCAGLNEGGCSYFTGHENICTSDQILPSDEAMFGSDQMPFLELDDLEAPLHCSAEAPNYMSIQTSNLTAAYNFSNTIEHEQPCSSSIPYDAIEPHLPSSQHPFPPNSIDPMCYPMDHGFLDQHTSASSYSSWQGCNSHKAPWT